MSFPPALWEMLLLLQTALDLQVDVHNSKLMFTILKPRTTRNSQYLPDSDPS